MCLLLLLGGDSIGGSARFAADVVDVAGLSVSVFDRFGEEEGECDAAMCQGEGLP